MFCNKQEPSVQTAIRECCLKILDLLWSMQISYNNYLWWIHFIAVTNKYLTWFSI